MGKSIKSRWGMTLVEILVGSMILTIFLGGLYKIFRASSKTVKAGMWVNGAQNQMRNALTYVRDELGRASQFTTVTADGPSAPDPAFKLQYKNGTVSPNYDGNLLIFWQCRTAVTFGTPDPGGSVKCTLRKSGRKLLYSKTDKNGTIDEPLFADKVLCNDIVGASIKAEGASNVDQMAKTMITLTLTAADPERNERQVVEETKAKVDVDSTAF